MENDPQLPTPMPQPEPLPAPVPAPPAPAPPEPEDETLTQLHRQYRAEIAGILLQQYLERQPLRKDLGPEALRLAELRLNDALTQEGLSLQADNRRLVLQNAQGQPVNQNPESYLRKVLMQARLLQAAPKLPPATATVGGKPTAGNSRAATRAALADLKRALGTGGAR